MAYDWEGIGNSIGNFVGSGAGQSLLAGGAGYLADKYIAGGSGKTGAVLGGLAGAGNYLTGEQGNLYGEGETNFNDSYLGGLLGGNQQAKTGIYGNPYQQSSGTDIRQVPEGNSYMNKAANAGMGLLGSAGKAIAENPLDAFKAYSEYKSGQAAQANAQSEIDYRNRIAQLQEDEYNYQKRAREATQSGLSEGFKASGLSNYYTA